MITVSSWTEFILNIIWSHRKQNWASVWGTFARSHRGDSSCHRKCSSAVSFNEWLLCQRWNWHSSASLWLFNTVFSICGEHVCPFSFGLNVFMWCVTVEHFLVSVFGYWRTSQQRCGLPAGGFLPPCFLYSTSLWKVSFTVQLRVWSWSVLCSCWVTAPSSLFTFSDLMLICGQHGAAVFLCVVFVLLHCISFR